MASTPAKEQKLFINEVQRHQARYRKLIQFTHSSTKAAGAMLLAAVVALIVANTGAYEAFLDFWHTEVGVFFGDGFAGMSLGHVINDIFMAIFFLLVGLEVKYELTVGELTNIRQALLPIVAAVGGVLAPIGIYLAFNATNPETAHGWGVPTATDIAFALGILALLGNRVPNGVRVFLSTLAVADDIIAILVIAIFYGHSPSLPWLAVAAVVLFVLVLMNRNHIYSLIPYLLVGAVLWYCVYMSGVHATIAGVLLAFTIPSGSRVNIKSFLTWSGDKVREARSAYQPETPVIAQGGYIETVQDLSRVARQVVPPATRLEHRLYPWVYFGILPLFALTNADVSFLGVDVGAMLSSPVLYGVLLGLLVGKPLGIMLFSMAVVKSKLASLPENVNWFHMLGASILGGVGFTMAIFVANLAFPDEGLVATAKLGILAASLLAGVLGFVLLLLQAKAAQKRGVAYLSSSADDITRQTAGDEAAREAEELLRDLEDPAIKDEVEAAKKRGGVFEIAVDLGPTGLLGGGSIGDVREAVRNEVVRVLREEGKDDLLEKVQEEFKEHAGEPPLASVEETLLRERGEDALLRAIRRESDDVVGMSGGKGGDEDEPRD
ncbi:MULTISPECIES: Na+/H+ antiporter NhaA [Gordonibacter]|uniref:Na(+)/H(+) antiporter NhaA n=1 Tax=Gordonibacter urolithinfaciens TaxID=1335613 RepID=A0A6N8IFE1_9ACTN|nr:MULTISPECIES: Na+/H+ antiporter NhaA [Gordonibacter]MBS6974737.1 Na+/H+ antiporter NhaA [Eggerthellaceae bacterium]MCB6561360.1 Na+/H+ antiporter NhaA [Gordonibacter urolithinfaciens]MDN4471010.1 Na+/H+ antiporter NhaA [Gordonibacter sp. RACS_AR68]MDN4508194.1 Na+/H+ antiporter NhaA [Gordonibacter sp. RACS_AR49]MVM53690.1 Na+/H+ antiporter NhaA [Gordonibacter urolithinfaciens]